MRLTKQRHRLLRTVRATHANHFPSSHLQMIVYVLWLDPWTSFTSPPYQLCPLIPDPNCIRLFYARFLSCGLCGFQFVFYRVPFVICQIPFISVEEAAHSLVLISCLVTICIRLTKPPTGPLWNLPGTPQPFPERPLTPPDPHGPAGRPKDPRRPSNTLHCTRNLPYHSGYVPGGGLRPLDRPPCTHGRN